MAAPTPGPSTADPALLAEEARLAHAAATGDGQAFATLYERYERRAYNLAYRISGSEDDAADAVQDAFLNVVKRLPSLEDRDLAFGSYLFTATRNACYDLMSKRKRAEPSDSIPESAAPLGSGAGGMGLDPGDPDDDPTRKLLLQSQQEEIRAANAKLPERQREVLALRELENLSYDEIAEMLDMNRNSVAQLISRARIKLRDELRGTALASIAISSPDCERALPLLAMRDDGQLKDPADADWLDAHLPTCDTCRLGLEAMQEAGTSYRAWTPIAASPLLFEDTMAKAAELLGTDWDDVIADRSSTRGGNKTGAITEIANDEGRRRRRRALAAGVLAAALLTTGVSTVLGDDNVPPAEPAVEKHEPAVTQATDPQPPKAEPKKAAKKAKTQEPPAAPTATDEVSPDGTPIPTYTPAADQPKGDNKPRRDPPKKPRRPKSQPEPEPTPPPAPTPPPTTPTPPPVEPPPPTEPTPPPTPPRPCRTCPPPIG